MTQVRLYVGTRKGGFVLTSTADREEWDISGPFLKGWEISNICVDDRHSPPNLYAGVGHFVYGPTIHRSRDLGETWEQVDSTPSFPEASDVDLNQIWTIEPGPGAEPEVLYAGVDDAGLFITRDGGDTWTELDGLRQVDTYDDWFPGNGGLCLHSICVHPTNPDRLWVGVSAVGVLRTDDRGQTWTLQNTGLPTAAPGDTHHDIGSCVHRLRLDPANPDRLYQQNHMGVFRSADAGDTWQNITDGLPSAFGFPLATHTTDPNTIYTVPLESDEYRLTKDGRPAVYRSTDAGDSWSRHDTGLPTDTWTSVLRHGMSVDTLDPAGIYVGTTAGTIYQSADAGDTWAELDYTLPRILSVTATVID